MFQNFQLVEIDLHGDDGGIILFQCEATHFTIRIGFIPCEDTQPVRLSLAQVLEIIQLLSQQS